MKDNRANSSASAKGYQPPRLRRLGTLAELTKGGTEAFPDGTGFQGAS